MEIKYGSVDRKGAQGQETECQAYEPAKHACRAAEGSRGGGSWGGRGGKGAAGCSGGTEGGADCKGSREGPEEKTGLTMTRGSGSSKYKGGTHVCVCTWVRLCALVGADLPNTDAPPKVLPLPNMGVGMEQGWNGYNG